MSVATKRVLVTGGAGFIGSHLVARLVTKGDVHVVVLDNLRRGSIQALDAACPRISFIEGDIRDYDAVCEAVRGASVVYHLAAEASVLRAVASMDYSFETNVAGTFNVLKAARSAGAQRVVFTSSREVYGEAAFLPVRETAPLFPKNVYGASKAAAEMYCSCFNGQGIETVVLRLANVYGPGDRDRVIPLFIERVLKDQPLTIYGADKILDFVWVGDVVDTLLAAAENEVSGQRINIGSGQGARLEEVAARIYQVTQKKGSVLQAPARSPEVDRYVADIALAVKVLGYKPAADPLLHLAETLPCAACRV